MGKLDPAWLAAQLQALEQRHARRHRLTIDSLARVGNPTRLWVGGQLLRNFCSNDYLGLSTHPALAQAANACMQQFGFGAGAAHLVTGHWRAHHALEEQLAAFTGRERALLFSTGYMANLGTVTALADRHDTLIADRLCHASLLDGARLSGAKLRRFAHADVTAAARLLESARADVGVGAGAASTARLLLTDGVFSMDGDIAPLAELAAISAQHDAMLIVDDAHGIGVLGATGRGTLELAHLSAHEVPLLVGTLGKALGSFGAFVAGDALLIDYLMQRARPYIFSTAMPPAVAAATSAALKLVQSEGWRRAHLQLLIARFRSAASAAGLPLSPSSTPIQPLIIGAEAVALALSEALKRLGFWVAAIRPPTVPPGTARLRITLSAAHTEEDVMALVEALATVWRESAPLRAASQEAAAPVDQVS